MMISSRLLLSISILSLFYTKIHSQEVNENGDPWENEDIQQFDFNKSDSDINQINSISLSLIRFYQKKIAPHSINRCPFHISCSNYTILSVKKHGLLIGLCMFIDRNLYRENFAAQYHYLLKNKNGELKYDDSIFLWGQ